METRAQKVSVFCKFDTNELSLAKGNNTRCNKNNLKRHYDLNLFCLEIERGTRHTSTRKKGSILRAISFSKRSLITSLTALHKHQKTHIENPIKNPKNSKLTPNSTSTKQSTLRI